MADEFVTLAENEIKNIDEYLNSLDEYLQKRYRKQIKEESLLKKITKNIVSTQNFTTIYEKALKKSKEKNCKVILAYIDLINTTQKINDKWITNNEIKKSIRNIESKIRDYADDTELQLEKLKRKFNNLLDEAFIAIFDAKDTLSRLEYQPLMVNKAFANAEELVGEINRVITNLKS